MFRTIRFVLLPLMALGLVFAAACSGEDDDADTPSPTTPAEPTNTPDTGDPTEEPAEPTGEPATPTPEPTEEPEPANPTIVDGAYAPGTRTGDAQLDAIIAAIEAGDLDALAALAATSGSSPPSPRPTPARPRSPQATPSCSTSTRTRASGAWSTSRTAPS